MPLAQLDIKRSNGQLVSWNRDVWFRTLDENHQSVLGSLPSPISRVHVRELSGQSTSLLIASMVWGFGEVGYGASRTHKMLTQEPRCGGTTEQVLDEIAKAASASAREGFSSLFVRGRARIPQLGVAMGTKFLHFAAANDADPQPLVLDVNVYKALVKHWKSAPDPRKYVRSVAYAEYCQWCFNTANRHGDATPADVEYSLFEIGKSSK